MDDERRQAERRRRDVHEPADLDACHGRQPGHPASAHALRDDVEDRGPGNYEQQKRRSREDRERRPVGEGHGGGSRMKPWRAAETSATASGKSTRMASLKAIVWASA